MAERFNATVLFQSTHPVGGGTGTGYINPIVKLFQSTHPVGGGTCSSSFHWWGAADFNPPTPWGVGLLN